MKNILFLSLCLSLGWMISGCKDEDRIHIPEYLTGVNMRIVLDPEHSTINSTSVATDFVAFDAYSENDDLSLVEFFIQYKDQVYLFATRTQADFNDGVEHFQFNASDLADWFDVPGFADGSRGGNFTISPRVTLTDGRVYPDYIHVSSTDSIFNVAGSVQSAPNSAFTVSKGTAILCPPVDISGSYTVVSSTGTSTDGCCPGEVTVSGNTVTIMAVAGSATDFIISDLTGGLYFEWYDVYGITGPDDSPGRVTFNCNEITFSTPEPFGTSFVGEGLWDPSTGTLTYSWSNGYADAGTVVLRRL